MAFITSNDTKAMYKHLSDAHVGDTITYRELSALVGYEVTSSTSFLTTARKQCLKEGVVFGVERGVGLKRLNDSEIVGTASSVMTRIRRTARRGATVLTKVKEFGALSNEEKQAHNANLSMMGAIAQMTKPSSIKSIESKIASSDNVLSFNKTLEMFRNSQTEKEPKNV